MAISDEIATLVDLALREDLGSGDITSEATIPENVELNAVIIAREDLVVCGQSVAKEVFRRVDERIIYLEKEADGAFAEENAVVAEIKGPARGILSAERTALNFMQHLSGIASQARSLIALANNKEVLLRDTRKTTPGWRFLEKYAVKTGGGANHRMGLFDAFLIKNNHVDAVGGNVAEAIRRCRALRLEGVRLQVEVRNESELRQALSEDPDSILLDNMSHQELTQMVKLVREELGNSTVELEASGGINSQTIAGVAKTGVNAISLGILTHSVKAADLSLRYCG